MMRLVMGTSRALKLYASAMLLLYYVRDSECQFLGMPVPLPPPELRPLCVSQFMLVNHACSLLPYTTGTPPTPPVPPIPPTPPVPPIPPTPPVSPPDDGRFVRYRRHHQHRHHRRGHRDSGPVEEDCCRWLNELDEQCVCDLLILLPPFLARAVHKYHVIVPDTCEVKYSCGGRLWP